MKIFINILIYQLIWFLCVMGETKGALLALPLLSLHLYLSPHKKADVQMMAGLGLTGAFIDGGLHLFGYIQFNVPAFPIPFWLAVIWLALATLPHHSLAWLKGRPLLSSLLGAIAGPLAYWAGIRMEAATFTMATLPSLFLLAILWAIIWPLAMYAAAKTLPKYP